MTERDNPERGGGGRRDESSGRQGSRPPRRKRRRKEGGKRPQVTTKLVAYKDKNRMQKRGTHLGLRLQNASAKELPHILQLISLVDEKEARTDR